MNLGKKKVLFYYKRDNYSVVYGSTVYSELEAFISDKFYILDRAYWILYAIFLLNIGSRGKVASKYLNSCGGKDPYDQYSRKNLPLFIHKKIWRF